MSPGDAGSQQPDTVGGLAELYLGNILYAIELAAHAMEQQGQAENAAFYRGIARKLAEAHGRAKAASGLPGQAPGNEP